MKKWKKRRVELTDLVNLALFFLAIFMISCGPDREDYKKQKVKTDSRNSGTLTVWCENSLAPLIETPIKWYKDDYPDVDPDVEAASSRKVMEKLLSGNARAVILSREYLQDEDSLMEEYNVEKHKRLPLARDALVFFTQKDFPLDSINARQIKKFLTAKDYRLQDDFPQLTFEPELAVTDIYSSEYWNMYHMAADTNKMVKRFTKFSTVDSVLKFVDDNPTAMGVAYLSRLVPDSAKYKMLAIPYYDSTGTYISPKPVHQGWIVQGYYPYIVKHWIYLLEDRMNLPYWFAMYFAREGKVQRYFKNSGIVPGYAKIKLKFEE